MFMKIDCYSLNFWNPATNFTLTCSLKNSYHGDIKITFKIFPRNSLKTESISYFLALKQLFILLCRRDVVISLEALEYSEQENIGIFWY